MGRGSRGAFQLTILIQLFYEPQASSDVEIVLREYAAAIDNVSKSSAPKKLIRSELTRNA